MSEKGKWYTGNEANNPGTPSHIRKRFQYHKDQRHTKVRIQDHLDHTIECYTDKDGKTRTGHRHNF